MKENTSSPTPICPTCSGEMEPGQLMGVKFTSFISDSERSKVFGRSVRVTAYRCKTCGYCEIYSKGSPRLFDFG